MEVDLSNPTRSAPRFGVLERSRARLVGTVPVPWNGEVQVQEVLMSL